MLLSRAQVPEVKTRTSDIRNHCLTYLFCRAIYFTVCIFSPRTYSLNLHTDIITPILYDPPTVTWLPFENKVVFICLFSLLFSYTNQLLIPEHQKYQKSMMTSTAGHRSSLLQTILPILTPLIRSSNYYYGVLMSFRLFYNLADQ